MTIIDNEEYRSIVFGTAFPAAPIVIFAPLIVIAPVFVFAPFLPLGIG